MLTMGDINLFCIGAVALGLLAGYLFGYSSRQEQPNGSELAALFGTVLGGTALSLLEQFNKCEEALPLYVIGVAVGYLAYILVLRAKWPLVEHLKARHGYSHAPLFPRNSLDPCSHIGANQCRCNDRPPTEPQNN